MPAVSRRDDPPAERAERLGRFELVERIGFGGMAEVYRARLVGPAEFSKTVVIKRALPQFRSDPLMTRMFVEEARIAAAADHDNIAKVYELGRAEDGQYFMVMEYIDGTDLDELLQGAAERGLKVPTWFTVHVVAQTLEALSFVHNLTDERGRPRNVVHRDATPSNIFVSKIGQVKLSDFGVAHFAGKSPTTQAGQLKGKIAYMSPEQLRAREIDARADLFSVGVVLWEALTQERLFGHLNEMRAMMAICDPERPAPSSRVPDLPPRLDEVCAKALALDREDRYPTAEAFQSDLLDVLHTLRPPVRPRDVKSVIEQLAGRRPPAEETRARAPLPDLEKSFLVPIDELDLDAEPAEAGPDTLKSEAIARPEPGRALPPEAPTPPAAPRTPRAPELDRTDADLLATVDEAHEPAIAMEIDELRALMAHRQDGAGPPTQPMPQLHPVVGAAEVEIEDSSEQTVAGRTLDDPASRPAPAVLRVRAGPGRPAEPTAWADVVVRARRSAEAGAGLEVAARGDDFVPLAELGRLTGQDLAYELEPPSNVTVVGQLSQRSLTAVLARLGVDRSTGVLTVARPSDGGWYELEVHQGRPCRVISPVPATQLPALLAEHSPLAPEQIADLCARAVAERAPLDALVRQMHGPDFSHGPFMQARLRVLFDWPEGDYTFNADLTRPQAAQAFAPSLCALLPDLVEQTFATERLTRRLAPLLRRKLVPDPRLLTAQALFTPDQRGVISKLVEAPVERALPAAPAARRGVLALVYVLLEGGLAT